MAHPFPLNAQEFATLGSAIFALLVIMIRLKAAKKPVNAKKILIPPLGMASGFLMFAFQSTHIPWMWAAVSFAAGVILFSYPLIRTSRFHKVDGSIYLQRSKSFIFILLGLLALRLILHGYVERYISLQQTGAVFFLLAFGMLLPWRIAMYIQYRRFAMADDASGSGRRVL